MLSLILAIGIMIQAKGSLLPSDVQPVEIAGVRIVLFGPSRAERDSIARGEGFERNRSFEPTLPRSYSRHPGASF